MAGPLAVAVLALAVSLLDLLLVLGIVRRLSAQASTKSAQDASELFHMGSGPPRGSRLPEFIAATVAGGTVDDTRYAGVPGCVAFVSATCTPCKAALTELEPYLRSAGIDKQHTLVVLDGDPAAESQEARRAAGFAEVVVGPDAARLIDQFGIAGFPTLIGVRSGVVTITAPMVGVLRGSAAGVVPTGV
jgi:hypothetical protein